MKTNPDFPRCLRASDWPPDADPPGPSPVTARGGVAPEGRESEDSAVPAPADSTQELFREESGKGPTAGPGAEPASERTREPESLAPNAAPSASLAAVRPATSTSAAAEPASLAAAPPGAASSPSDPRELDTPTEEFEAERLGRWHLPLDFVRSMWSAPLPKVREEDLLKETIPPAQGSARRESTVVIDDPTDPKGFRLSPEEAALLRQGPSGKRRLWLAALTGGLFALVIGLWVLPGESTLPVLEPGRVGRSEEPPSPADEGERPQVGPGSGVPPASPVEKAPASAASLAPSAIRSGSPGGEAVPARSPEDVGAPAPGRERSPVSRAPRASPPRAARPALAEGLPDRAREPEVSREAASPDSSESRAENALPTGRPASPQPDMDSAFPAE